MQRSQGSCLSYFESGCWHWALWKGRAEGGLCKVWVYVFILFTLCSFNRDNKMGRFCWCLCTDMWPTNKAHTHTCACAGDVFTVASCWRVHHWQTGIASDYFFHHPDLDILLPPTFDVRGEIMCKTSNKLVCIYLSLLLCVGPCASYLFVGWLIYCLFVANTSKWNPEWAACFPRADPLVTRTSCLTELGFDRLK